MIATVHGGADGNCADVSIMDGACVNDVMVRAHGVAQLYAPDAVLLATVSPQVCRYSEFCN